MTSPHYILLPANGLFVGFSLLLAFVLNLLPNGGFEAMPDFVALVLVFWSIHQPRKVGIGIAFFMGLLMDVHNASLMGENALAYTLLSYVAIMLHRRVLWFPVGVQMTHIFPLLLVAQIVQLLLHIIISRKFPGWWYFSSSFVATMLWPVVTWLLLAPQRRAVNHDETRPL